MSAILPRLVRLDNHVPIAATYRRYVGTIWNESLGAEFTIMAAATGYAVLQVSDDGPNVTYSWDGDIEELRDILASSD